VLNSGGRSVLSHHSSSLRVALRELYPEVPFPSYFEEREWSETRTRDFFDHLAGELNFDPLVAENWLQLKRSELTSRPEGQKLLRRYGGSYERGLWEAYPELDLHTILPIGEKSPIQDWKDPSTRRGIFDRIANSLGFDPLVANNWYSVTFSNQLSKKETSALVFYHGSFAQALIDLYPESNFAGEKIAPKQDEWATDNPANQRQFFIDLAKNLNFNYQLPENWYGVTHSLIEKHKGRSILSRHGNSHITALITLFPELNLDRNKFHKAHHWSNKKNSRAFFDEFAREAHFDPLFPDNWYDVRLLDILAKPSGRSVLRYYGNSKRRALVQLYPDVFFAKWADKRSSQS